MALYLSSHITACLTKQAVRELMSRVFRVPEVTVRRAIAGQLAGRMVLEIEARDQATVERWIEANRLNAEWVMRVDQEGGPQGVREW